MAITITGKGLTTHGPNAVRGDELLFYMDPGNTKSICSYDGTILYDQTDKGIVSRNRLNITNPVLWNSACFESYDEMTPTSFHYIPGTGCSGNYAYFGYDLNSKVVISWTTWQISFTLEVISGWVQLRMGSAGSGFQEGPHVQYNTGTYLVDRTFYVYGVYDETHEALTLEFGGVSQKSAEVRISNLDVRERGNDVILVNGAAVVNNAVSLDGTDDLIGTAFRTNTNFSNNDVFSVSIWVMPTADINTYGGLVCNQLHKSESGPGGFGIVTYPTNKVGLSLTNSSTESFSGISEQTLTKDVWQNIVYTYEPSSNTVYGYKNGVLGNSSTNASYNWTTQAKSTRIGTSTQMGWVNYTAMKIGAVKIFKKTLSPTEVLQDYNSLKGRYRVT